VGYKAIYVGIGEPLSPKALKPIHVNALLREAQQKRHAARDYALIRFSVILSEKHRRCSEERSIVATKVIA
jgi:hypothetical protein